jgi:hypothetical protein
MEKSVGAVFLVTVIAEAVADIDQSVAGSLE